MKTPKRKFTPTYGHAVVERYAAKQAGLIVLPATAEPKNEWYVTAVNDPRSSLKVGDIVTIDSQKVLAILDGHFFLKCEDVLAVHEGVELEK